MNKLEVDLLTIVIPTQNRARSCLAQLQLLRNCGLKCRILVADSSEQSESEIVRSGCAGLAEYLKVDRALNQYQQFSWVARYIQTPYLVFTPDDDITFPYAIE